MALTADRTTQGFELVGNLLYVTDPGTLWELTPGEAFAKGDMVVLSAGKVTAAAANATNVLGVMAQSVAAADNPAAGCTYGRVYTNPFNIYRCSFADHTDSTATGGTTTTLVDTALSSSSNDYWNGALLYIYEGTNAGLKRTISDYTGSSDTLTFTDPMPSACDTTSKYIILGASGSGDVINKGSIGVDLKDANTIDANATIASEAGPLLVMEIYPEKLMMDVMLRKSLFNTV